MKPTMISCAEARGAGLGFYYTGKPCKHGHVTVRRTSSKHCMECERTRPQRAAHLMRRYGMTSADFEATLAQQGGRCKICRSDDPGSKFGWHVDHCHSKGHVRGLLCTHCNRGLGGAQDSIATLEAMIEYLRHSLQ